MFIKPAHESSRLLNCHKSCPQLVTMSAHYRALSITVQVAVPCKVLP
jgi:hypothetical protein